jgi:hypothetical protein
LRLLRVLGRALLAAGRIRDHRFWRLLYWVLSSRIAVAVGVAALGAIERARGAPAAEFVVARFDALFVRSGWPAHQPGWVNLDASRFLWRVRLRRRGRRPRARKRPAATAAGPLRLGCVGRFSGLLAFGPKLFAETPAEIELHIFDCEYAGRAARYLEGLAAYTPLPGDAAPSQLADAVNDAALDALLLVLRGGEAYELANLVTVPCLMFVCTGSDLLHHPSADVQLYAQREADYLLRGRRLFCATSRAPFGEEELYPAFFPYDARGLDASSRRGWEAREPLAVVHGSLYKVASPAYLDCLARLLQADAALELVLMGKDDGRSLAEIRARMRAAGVESRVHYEGVFSPVRAADGTLDDPGWQKLVGLLGRARLAPDPFPVCGATARVEVFGAGVPSPHLAVRFDEASWGRSQDAVVELEALRVPLVDAPSVAAYEALCRRCLVDDAFADQVAAAQGDVFARVTDGAAYWRQILTCYDEWARRVGVGAEDPGTPEPG